MDAVNDFNQLALDPVGPVGGDQEMAVLKEMDELVQAHEQIIRDGGPKISLMLTPDIS
jgi:hypothetical protein